MQTIDIIKRDHVGTEVIRYPGQILQQDQEKIILQAAFNKERVEVHGLTFLHGDKMIETYYFDRWYNIFEIYQRNSDVLKGWYCNIGHPAIWEDNAISYRDLALDLLVFPDGRQVVLDEDEFAALTIEDNLRTQALGALAELQRYFNQRNH